MSANNLRDASHNLHEQLARPQAPRGNSIMSRNLDPMDAIDSIFVRLDRQLARIAALETDVERLESASGVPQEPGNATEAHGPQLADAALEYVHGALMEIANALGVRTASDYEEGQDAPNWKLVERILATAGEVAAALRMYRKVQALTVVEACGIMRVTYELAAPEVTALLAWLKEGEA